MITSSRRGKIWFVFRKINNFFSCSCFLFVRKNWEKSIHEWLNMREIVSHTTQYVYHDLSRNRESYNTICIPLSNLFIGKRFSLKCGRVSDPVPGTSTWCMCIMTCRALSEVNDTYAQLLCMIRTVVPVCKLHWLSTGKLWLDSTSCLLAIAGRTRPSSGYHCSGAYLIPGTPVYEVTRLRGYEVPGRPTMHYDSKSILCMKSSPDTHKNFMGTFDWRSYVYILYMNTVLLPSIYSIPWYHDW